MIGIDSWERRQFLKSLGAAGAATLLPPAAHAAPAYRPRRIDVHHHVPPPAYVQWMAEGNATFHSPLDTGTWTLADALAQMDKFHIAAAIVSSPDLNGRLPGDFAGVVRSCNEWLAKLTVDHPGRFGCFGMMPLPKVDATLAEIAYVFDTLKSDGVRFAPSYAGKYLGDSDFDPVMAELNRRKAVAFVHPTQPQCCGQMMPDVVSAVEEFPFDTMRTITSLLYSGQLAKYPDIRWIFSHGGGTLPMLAGRISGGFRNPKMQPRAPKGPIYELKKVYVDTASVYFPWSWAGVNALSGPHHILFGTDDPYIKIADVDAGLAALHLPQALRAAVDRENALPLFPRFRP
ncbi:MAG TPA: amidohydrolase family protein [Stellaceae bacterium]|jgi:predicted TIM-barrel fold metal-dependent hydrolase